MDSKSKQAAIANDWSHKRGLIRRRKAIILVVAILVALLIAYSVPVIIIAGCPDSWGCPYGVHGLIHVSITRYFFHFGAESSPLGYSLG